MTKGGKAFNRTFRKAFIAWRAEMEANLSAAPYTNAIKSSWDKVCPSRLLPAIRSEHESGGHVIYNSLLARAHTLACLADLLSLSLSLSLS